MTASQTTLDFLGGRDPKEADEGSSVYGSVYFDALRGNIDGAQIRAAIRRTNAIMSGNRELFDVVGRQMGCLKSALEHLLSYGDIAAPKEAVA